MSWYAFAFADAAVEAAAVGVLAGVAGFGLLQGITALWDACDRLRARKRKGGRP